MSDRAVFSMPWVLRLLMVVGAAWVLGGSDIVQAVLRSLTDDMYRARFHWPMIGALAVAPAAVILCWTFTGRTVLTREGISVRQIGRPLRWPRRTFVPWEDIAAIDVYRGVYGTVPVFHLKEGGAVLARLPVGMSRRFTESIARIQRWHLQATGLNPEQLPAAPAIPKPGRRRPALLAGLAAALVAVAVMLAIVDLSRDLHDPPDVPACPLVPAALVQRVVPGAPHPFDRAGGSPGPGGNCTWDSPVGKKLATARLTVSVFPYPHGSAAEALDEDRRQARAEHIVHAMPRGYSWAAFDSGATIAQAHVRAGDRLLKVSLHSIGYGLTPAQTERQAGQVATAAAARLDGAPS